MFFSSFILATKKDGKDSGSTSNTKKDESVNKKDDIKNDTNDNKKNDRSSSKDTMKKQSSFPPPTTTDAVRLKCRELLVTALRVESEITEVHCGTPDELAEKLEDLIYAEFKNTDSKYKNRVSLIIIIILIILEREILNLYY